MTNDLPHPPGADLLDDLELVVRAVRRAGMAVLPAFRMARDSGQAAGLRLKAADQPVTDADLLADRILRETLLAARPGYGWLSEETADSPERLAREAVWVVDPIDGTNSFVEGIGDWVVCAGLAVGGVPAVAAVFNPVRNELYHAARGLGAYVDRSPEPGLLYRGPVPLRVTSTAEESGEAAPVLLASRAEIARGEFDPLRDAWRVEPLGSTAYRMVRVAEGAGSATFSRGPKNEWDLCAAALVLSEAGGRATDAHGAELRFNRPDPRIQGIAATNGALHDTVLARIAALPG